MTIDPGAYDPDELRRLAHGSHDAGRRAAGGGDRRSDRSFAGGAPRPGAAGSPGRATESLRAAQVDQLFFLQSATDGLEKPYLRELPASFAAEEVVFEWLDFLVERGGFRRTYEALRYYRSIGWLAEPVVEDLEAYLAGFPPTAEPSVDGSDATGGATARDHDAAFDVDDHRLSLVYVARLAALTD